MPIGIKSCSAGDIREVNQSKEYTLISTHLLQSLFADPNLNPQAIKCWQLLFNLARFNPNLEITMSYSKIAYQLNRSKRTIIRYVHTLTQNGYLETIANFDTEYGKKANTLLVRVPTMVIDKVKNSRDRGTTKETKSTSTVLKGALQTIDLDEKPTPLITLKKEVRQNPLTQPSYSTETIDILERGQEVLTSNSELKYTCLETKLSSGASDKTVTANNINYINNNNNVVVVDSLNLEKVDNDSSTEPEITFNESTKRTRLIFQLTLEKKELEARDNQEGKRLAEFSGNPDATYQHLQYLGHMRGKISSLEKDIARLTKEAAVTQKKQITEENLTTQTDHMLKKPGDRMIHAFTFNRVVKTLESLGYKDNQLTWLINEIVFEVRFGSLTKSSITGEILSTDHAINIALKLVREKRWTTPALFKKSEGII